MAAYSLKRTMNRAENMDKFDLLALSAGGRIGGALSVLAVLWLAVVWAL